MIIFLLLSFYILSPSLIFFPNILNSIIVAFLVIIYVILLKRPYPIKYKKNNLIFVLVVTSFALYGAALSTYYQHELYFSQVSLGFVLSILIAQFLSIINIQQIYIIKYTLLIITFNTAIIYLEMIFPDFRILIESFFIPETTTDFSKSPFKYRGLARGGGSSLSIFYGFIIALVILIMNETNTFNKKSILIIFFNIPVLFFIGRSGLFVIFLTLIYIFINRLYILFVSKKIKLRVRSIFLLITLISFLFYLSSFTTNEILMYNYEVLSIFLGESIFLEVMIPMLTLPEIDFFQLLFGIGYFDGKPNFAIARSDSGYVKTITSIGLICSIFLYFLIYIKFYNNLNLISSNRLILLLMLVIAELKEPFLFQNYLGRFIPFLLFLIPEREKNLPSHN